MEKVKRSNGSKCCLLHRNSPVLPLDAEKLQEGIHVGRVYHPPDPHHPRKDMHHPALVGVVAQAFHQRVICLLLPYGCS
jgi:hypothetical protein